ncbi:MAG: hypothetical protein H6707_07405 [Deltaproteobacteria bacterium]|nr:hypothetical protein [Deltaproteobacteria bacterium]
MTASTNAALAMRAGHFDPPNHYYPRVLNAQIHPTLAHFLALDGERIVARYCHMNPRVDPRALDALLHYPPRHFRWAGADLFHVATATGRREMVVIETNSCPSGQKSMPLIYDTHEEGGYQRLLEQTFLPALKGRRLPNGGLAVVYDKNYMENSGYAATLAQVSGEPVFLAPFHAEDSDPPVRFVDGVMQVRDGIDHWIPIRAAFRYVTQKPWTRIPVHSKTLIFNPTLACLAGGRNKMVAAKAYELFNAELADSGLQIRIPETIWDVSHREIPLWVRKLGGLAVVKVPYSNAGQGVYTITNDAELGRFMEIEQRYDQFIVQSLIGNIGWSSTTERGRLYHVGTVPNKRCRSYAADLRMMINATADGWRPLAIYARRAREPLAEHLTAGEDSWPMLGTNLSIKRGDGSWDTEAERLLLMDRKDFNLLGLGIDDVIEAFVQTMLSTIAIDKLAITLINKKGRFRNKLFGSLNNDRALLDEIKID